MAQVTYLGRIFKPVGRTGVVDRPVGRTGVVDRPAGHTGVVDRLTVDGVGGHGEVRKSDNRSFARREMNSILKFSMLTSMIIFGGRFGGRCRRLFSVTDSVVAVYFRYLSK